MPPQKDVDYHYPYALRTDYKEKLDNAIRYIQEDGMKMEDAVALAYGIYPKRWYYWVQDALDDIDKGMTNTPLVNVVLKLHQADAESSRRLSRRARDLALDDEEPSVEMLKFLLERRHGYKKQTQQEVEVSTPEDFSFNINITESQKKDE